LTGIVLDIHNLPALDLKESRTPRLTSACCL
jgi:hypothetical protein